MKKNIWANEQRIMELFTPKNCHLALKKWVWDPRSGKESIPDPGSRDQKGTRSTRYLIVIGGVFLMLIVAECSAAQRCGVSFPESHAGRALQIGPRHSGRRSSRLWAKGRSDSLPKRYNYGRILTLFAVSFLLCTWRIFCKYENKKHVTYRSTLLLRPSTLRFRDLDGLWEAIHQSTKEEGDE